MSKFFLPIVKYKTISTNLSETEIHERLDKLNYQYNASNFLINSNSSYISYFQGDNSFRAEETDFRSRGGTYYITAYGNIIKDSEKIVITIEYVLDDPYLKMFLSVYLGFLLLGWIMGLAIFINNIRYGDYSAILIIIILLFMTMIPWGIRFFLGSNIDIFHGKLFRSLNKKG